MALAVSTLLAVSLLAGCGGDIESRMAEVRALQDVGQFPASIDELREILTVDPNLPEANFRLGLALVQTGEPSRAIWPLQKAAESSEYEITAGVLLASTYFKTNNFDEAIRSASRVLETNNGNSTGCETASRNSRWLSSNCCPGSALPGTRQIAVGDSPATRT